MEPVMKLLILFLLMMDGLAYAFDPICSTPREFHKKEMANEKLFASEYKDKTDWRKMLKGDQEFIDLPEKRDELFELFGEELDQLEHQFGEDQVSILEQESEIEIHYPVIAYPEKVSSLSVEKLGIIGGTLKGIKGQYLLFDTGVINIRSHTGYRVHLEF